MTHTKKLIVFQMRWTLYSFLDFLDPQNFISRLYIFMFFNIFWFLHTLILKSNRTIKVWVLFFLSCSQLVSFLRFPGFLWGHWRATWRWIWARLCWMVEGRPTTTPCGAKRPTSKHTGHSFSISQVRELEPKNAHVLGTALAVVVKWSKPWNPGLSNAKGHALFTAHQFWGVWKPLVCIIALELRFNSIITSFPCSDTIRICNGVSDKAYTNA